VRVSNRIRPVAIDLFSGAGGLSLGLEQAGFDVAAAVEIDPIHACVHKFNFPECEVIPTSIVELTGQQIRRRTGLLDSRVHLVAGGPPCQGFSLIGQRALEDPRNSLVLQFVRIVRELDADYFLFENVKGLTLGKHRCFLDEVIQTFESNGYWIRRPWSVLNAVYYGVPQDRERLFLLGGRRGLPLPSYPSPFTYPAGTGQTTLDLIEGPSSKDALEDLPDADRFPELMDSDSASGVSYGEPSAYAREMRCTQGVGWHYGYCRTWDATTLTSSARTTHSAISRRRFNETKQGDVEPISRFFRLSEEGVSNTLRAGTDSARGAFTSPRPIHYRLARCVTVREMARLHGFPDWFRFHATKWHGARQIGNAIAPPLARAVGLQIMAAMGQVPTRPERVVELGEAKLLHLGMSDASAYWQVAVPIKGRDRKSGARKRSQQEIEFGNCQPRVRICD
jgi:DNA (cytosine-5)-methyltransferase 1